MAAAVPTTPEQIWKLETNHEEWLLRQRQRETEAIFTRARCYTSTGDSYMYDPVLCLSVSVCLSVTSPCSIETDERIELVFGVVASFYLFYAVLKGNSGISKIRALLSGTLSQTPDLKNFALAYRLLIRVVDLAPQRWTLRAW